MFLPKISKESGCRDFMDNSFQQLRNKMLLRNKNSLYFCGFFFFFLKKREKASTILNKNSHRTDKSSDWVVQITKEMVTALGHFGLRC